MEAERLDYTVALKRRAGRTISGSSGHELDVSVAGRAVPNRFH